MLTQIGRAKPLRATPTRHELLREPQQRRIYELLRPSPQRKTGYSTLVGIGLVACCTWANTAHGERTSKLGSYERQALHTAQTRLGLEIDSSPNNKILGHIYVVNLDVFLKSEGRFLRWFNIFHRTTRDDVIRREVILRPGQIWDEQKLVETERKLRDPLFTTLVVMTPVKSNKPGQVDLLVVTRDVWSLRFNSNFELQEGKLTEATLSLSENNLFGWRKQLALVFDLNQGAYSLGPLFIDKNIAGSRLQLSADAAALFNRQTDDVEGSRARVSLTYPLWSLDSKWGAGISFSRINSIPRVFQGAALRTYDAPETAEDDALPFEYRQRSLAVETSVTRSLGKKTIHRFTTGHQVISLRPRLLPGFPGSDEAQAAFIRDVLPRSEATSRLFLRYRMFQPRFVAYRNISTYDLAEDARLGPELTAEVAPGLEVIGSDVDHVIVGAGAGYTHDIRKDGFWRIAASAGGRIQGSDLIDNIVSGSARLVSPRLFRAFRIVTRVSGAARIDETANRFLTLGGRTGLRGYAIGQFFGQVRVVGNLELRSMPFKLWVTRAGALVFWDVGHAADTVGDLRLRHDFGIGLRSLIPQLSPLVYRLDWAIATHGPSKGLPGRITAGVEQVF